MPRSPVRLVAFALAVAAPLGACGRVVPPETPPPTGEAPPAAAPSTAPSNDTATPPTAREGAADGGSPAPDAATDPRGAGDAGAPPEGMRLVPAGTFTMGAATGGEGDERPAHAVTLGAFWLDTTEVTQAAYAACVEAGVCRAPDPGALAAGRGAFRGPARPVVGVSWHDARAYCTFVGKRLPREAEHERAVRGDDGRRFPWGDDPPSRDRTVFAQEHPEDVATRPAGRGPYGHDDLAGNVWEWMEDAYDPYAYRRDGAARGEPGTCAQILEAQDELRRTGQQGFTGSNPIPTECERSIRGGAYNYPGPGLRSTNRVHHPASFRLKMTGVRCARDA